SFLQLFGLPSVNWYSSYGSKMLLLILSDSWKNTPIVAMILLAGMTGISPELYNAAAIDGAGPVRRFLYVTLPNLRNFILIALVSRVMQYVLVSFVSALFLYPLYILFLISFSPVQFTLGTLRPLQWPGGFTLQNLVQAIQGTNLVDPTIRSLTTASLVGVITLLFGIPAAYGLSRLPNNVSNMISALLFLVNMIPALVIAIPISVSFITLHLYNTILGLALAQGLIALPFTIFLLLGAFQS